MEIPPLSEKQTDLLLRSCLSCGGVRLRGGQHRTARKLQALRLGRRSVGRGFAVFRASERGRKVALRILPDGRR